jgi:hypothetical protein
MATHNDLEKPNSAHVEACLDEKDIGSSEQRNGDYSGAVKKTSPEEIRLVRKMDIRIMSTLWAMYFLVSTTRAHLVYVVHDG